MQRRALTVAWTLAVVAAGGAACAALVVWRGLYDVGAMTQHTQPVYSLLETAMANSVQVRATGVVVPPLDAPGLQAHGAACYRDHCVQCHGAPGVPPGPVGMSMQPLPGPLQDAPERWRPNELYWITRNGIRMSGMPAWGMRLDDDDLWALVGFIRTLPAQTPAGYQAVMAQVRGLDCTLPGGDSAAAAPAPGATDDLADRAPIALRQYACVSCHQIPGVTGSKTLVGPPLDGIARRQLIAGRLPNTPPNMALWLREPQAVKPGSAMPDLGVTAEHAELMARYLARLH